MAKEETLVFRKSYGAAVWSGIAFAIAGIFLYIELSFANTTTMNGEILISVFSALGLGFGAWFWFRPALQVRPEDGDVRVPGESVDFDAIRGVALQTDFEGDDSGAGLVFVQILTGRWLSLARQFDSPDLDVDDAVSLTILTGAEDDAVERLATAIDEGSADRPEAELRELREGGAYDAAIEVKSQGDGSKLERMARRISQQTGAPVIDLTEGNAPAAGSR